MPAPNEIELAPNAIDLQDVVEQLARFERLDELEHDQLEAYVGAKMTFEGMLMSQAGSLTTNCQHADANELLDQVIELNQTMRQIADREQQRTAATDPSAAEDWSDLGDLADGLLLVTQGTKLINEAEACRLAGNVTGAIDAVQQAMDNFARLANSDPPLDMVGQLLGEMCVAQTALYTSLMATGAGIYQGALADLTEVQARYNELLAELMDVMTMADQQLRPMFGQFAGQLSSALVDIATLEALNELLLAAQNGEFSEVIKKGRKAADAYQTSILAVRSAGPHRNAVALRQMELEYVEGWVQLATAEMQMDQAEWDDAARSISTARDHWKNMSGFGARSQVRGVLAQRPDNTSLEFLIKAAQRRLNRERDLRSQISTLQDSLREARLATVNFVNNATATAQARGTHTMSGDINNFQGPVAAGAIGSNARANAVQQSQQVQYDQAPPVPYQESSQPQAPRQPDGVDRRRLAEQLTDLAEVLGAGPRSERERNSVELVRQASEAARRGDDAGVRGHLAGTAPWVLEVAESIGVETAAAAVRQSIGV